MVKEEWMPTTREELAEFVKDYLKENLTISVTEERESFSNSISINVALSLWGKVISSDYFYKTYNKL